MNLNQPYTALPPFCFERTLPTPLQEPKLIHKTYLTKSLGIDLSDAELCQWLNGELNLQGEDRISTRYGGHQFGVWAGQLGDGRALSLGVLNGFEIQTKGSGLTPFSRMGDGKAVIRSSVREYLCSEAMHGLKIPTSRVLALITGTDKVYRETVERSGLIARVFESNIRFGHFELFYHYGHTNELKALREYTKIDLVDVCTKTAKLIAQWMGVGFCHGVMNTDNMSIHGITIDYGPFGFMEDTQLNYICNHSDTNGRYSYHQQPSVALWNLERLFVCFLNEFPKEKLEEILNTFPQIYSDDMEKIGRKKLGLYTERSGDYLLFNRLLRLMHELSLDFTFTFRQLSGDMKEFWEMYGTCRPMEEWLKEYKDRLSFESLSEEERLSRMKSVNPKYVLKNYIAQEVIADVESSGSKRLHEWLDVFYDPFQEHPDFHSYSKPTPYEHKHHVVSCSS